jgi:membrane-bound metal-dependent hydrolase YbcI (DUF457 family)
MFIGHFALGLAAKRATPRVSLAVLFGAAQLADLLWPILVGLGVEKVAIQPGNTAFTPLEFISYPYSHSLALLACWGVAFGLAFSRGNRRTFVVLALLVVSHWVLDYVTHRPDMPLYPGGPKVGLGLWNSVPGTIAVEVPMYLAGLWIYYRMTRPRDRAGRYGFGFLAAALLVIYAGNLTAPPPPSVNALWTAALGGAVIILAASLWADRHRDAV